MKDFAKSIVCNTKAEADKVGNFEDPKDAKRYIQMWERRKQDAKSWIDDANRKLKELHKDHGGAFGSLSESEKRSHKAEAQRHEDTIRKYQAEFEKYDNLIKQAQKSTWGNTRTGNSNKAEIIEKKKKEGATLKVDNGQKLEFSDGSTYVKTSFSDDYREAHNYTGNKKVGNATIVDLMGQAKEYNTKFWEAYRKGDQKEAEKWSGYAKILKRQIAEERSDIQQRLKKLDEAEKMISFSY